MKGSHSRLFDLWRSPLRRQPFTSKAATEPPGSGKTTLARELEVKLPAIRMSADDWMLELEINLHDETVRAKIEALQWQLTKRLLAVGNKVIVEWGSWGKWERDLLRTEARDLGASVELHYLSVPLDELFRRIQRRDMETPPIHWEAVQEWGNIFEPPTIEEVALFDTPLLPGSEWRSLYPTATCSTEMAGRTTWTKTTERR